MVLGLFACNNDNKTTKTAESKKEKKTVIVPVFNADSAYRYVKKQIDFGPRVPESKAHEQCAEWLVSMLDGFSDTVYVQNFRTRLFDGRGIDGKNIIGVFNPDAKKRIVLAAHWDTRPYADADPDRANWNTPIDGANDGASGVGVLLEIARQLHNRKIDDKIGVDIVLFDLEDYGAPSFSQYNTEDSWCLGSQYWSKYPHKNNYSAYYGILLDMVGVSDPSFPKEYYSQQFAPDISNKVWRVARGMGYDMHFSNELGHPITDDHYYMNKIAGIPTINIIHLEFDSPNGSFYEYWHTLKDDIESIDPKSLDMVGNVVLNVIYNE